MKKIMMFLLASVFAGINAAETIDIEKAKREAKVITWSVTISRPKEDDKPYNRERWEKLIEDTANVVKHAQTGGKGGSADEMIAIFVRGLEMMIQQSNRAVDGIGGEMNISISDGMQKAACGDTCPCISKYKGICPCTAENNCSSKPEQIRAACCGASCQKSGICDANKCAQTGCVQECSK